VKATTHTEVYRKFEGEHLARPLRALVLARAGVRLGFKRKLPALLLYTPIAIACTVTSFKVFFSFAVASGEMMGEASGTPVGHQIGRKLAELLGDTVQNIFQFQQNAAKFVLVLMAWYGSGLISEDKRLGANLLYFSRPLSRREYIGGKFLALSWFGYLALLLPCLIICFVATFSSPDWSLLRNEWETFPQVVLFSVLWVSTMSIVVLTVSSLTDRRTHALVGATGLVYGASAVSNLLARIMRDARTTTFDLFSNMERVGETIFGVTLIRDRAVSTDTSLAALALLWVACLFLLTERVRRLEVVA